MGAEGWPPLRGEELSSISVRFTFPFILIITAVFLSGRSSGSTYHDIIEYAAGPGGPWVLVHFFRFQDIQERQGVVIVPSHIRAPVTAVAFDDGPPIRHLGGTAVPGDDGAAPLRLPGLCGPPITLGARPSEDDPQFVVPEL